MKLSLYIPDHQFEELELLAAPKSVEAFILDRLSLLQKIDTKQPYIIMDGPHLTQLSLLLNGLLIRSADDLIKEIRRTQRVRVDGIDVTLDSDTLSMLFSQAEGMGIEPEEYIRQAVVNGLEFTCGAAATMPYIK